jgi:DNA sulfur modification protein DndE
MEVKIDRVRMTFRERNYLIRLKGHTGIDNWNIFARWAFCCSLTHSDNLDIDTQDGEYGIEMSWMIFAGKHYKLYQDLLVNECQKFQLEPNKANLTKILRAHLRNGVNLMFTQVKSLDDLVELINVH